MVKLIKNVKIYNSQLIKGNNIKKYLLFIFKRSFKTANNSPSALNNATELDNTPISLKQYLKREM